MRNNLIVLFCCVFFVIASSCIGLIVSSELQLGELQPISLEEGEELFPKRPVGVAQQGKQVYKELGCVACHTQQVRRKDYGSDCARKWGNRQAVPRDYIFQDHVLLGSMRIGQDLMDVGTRLPDENWHHVHLFNPRIFVPDSNMPSYAFLYEIQKIDGSPSPDAIHFPEANRDVLEPEYEVIPSQKAKALVAYLQSLTLNYELPESRFGQ